MATFKPPIASKMTPRFGTDAEGRPVSTTRMQRALYKYMRPLDRGVNTYILSDHTVVTDVSVVLSDGSMSTVAVPYPITTWAGPTIGAAEGAEGGPFGTPPPYAETWSGVTGQQVYTPYVLNPHLLYWFAGGRGGYPNISANLVAILTAAKFDNYIV